MLWGFEALALILPRVSPHWTGCQHATAYYLELSPASGLPFPISTLHIGNKPSSSWVTTRLHWQRKAYVPPLSTVSARDLSMSVWRIRVWHAPLGASQCRVAGRSTEQLGWMAWGGELLPTSDSGTTSVPAGGYNPMRVAWFAPRLGRLTSLPQLGPQISILFWG